MITSCIIAMLLNGRSHDERWNECDMIMDVPYVVDTPPTPHSLHYHTNALL